MLQNDGGTFPPLNSIYKIFNLQGGHWLLCTLLSTFLVPCIILGTYFIVGLILDFERALQGITFDLIVDISSFLFGVSAPLNTVGSFCGFKHPRFENPCDYNPVPKLVEKKPWFANAFLLSCFGGGIPFL
jgi:transmembrane 9 superfamily member 2/4